jgi:EPS-associated MarR family transcriptional regulator
MDVYNSEECLDLLQLIQEHADISQRQMAKKSGLSLGKVNYCIKALIEVGYIKINKFKKTDSKLNHIYLLTSSGVVNKTLIAKKFLLQKGQEYDKLKSYINK